MALRCRSQWVTGANGFQPGDEVRSFGAAVQKRLARGASLREMAEGLGGRSLLGLVGGQPPMLWAPVGTHG